MTPLDSALDGLSANDREKLVRLASTSSISEHDPLWVIVAAVRTSDLTQQNVALAREISGHAASLRRANLRNVAFLIGLAATLGVVLGAVVTLAVR